MNAPVAQLAQRKSGFRDLKVVAKIRESSVITSFHLEPADPDGWRAFQPGQFLVFRIPVPGRDDFVLRNYSVSCSPAREGSYRITVKREAAPQPGLPDGVSSCYLHDAIEVGDVLAAEGPRGEFVLDRTSTRPVLLLSGGVGLTPMVSMLHALTATDRRVHFVHACDNGDVHALRDEVEALAASRPGIKTHFCYRFPTERDKADKRHHSEGLISRELLQSLLPLDDYEVYLCGPPPFMQAVYQILRGLGIERHRIAYEFFGPATVLEQAPAAPVPAAAPPSADKAVAGDGITVEFRKSGLTAMWDEEAGSLLDFAEAQGLSPDFSCRAGICSTCKSRLVEGEVAYFEEPLDELGAGEMLLCCSKPQGPVVIDI
ncbi:2Fe-2S iron-sulfur cluster binding domain-containing protein [Pseudaminobacter arsenicus]|uniref:nitric oxide dioxygenase n=1 Tax=Borborobacter arsenicus TaxID=1851146 RepID=A0A432V1K0_9HYPH|nr:2Fe-2S iron-sulfur cluster-binding protein [Pseudaminobacter arsenicus]RUM96067.1 2Fe-2S iron-sulfur cluster binding domain-containing protein [Pseudaminobacter arsenicus]